MVPLRSCRMESSKPEQLFVEPAGHRDPVLGELRALLDQLGTADDIHLEALSHPEVASWDLFRGFIATFKSKVLYEHELPAIYRAYRHARANEGRELIELDQQLAESAKPFAEASRRIGQLQLQWLTPLRGERVVAKYYAALQKGQAQGWHTLVYGLTLAVYSIPARQGLVGYATQILRRYIDAAGRTFSVQEPDRTELLEELCADLPQRVDAVLSEKAR